MSFTLYNALLAISGLLLVVMAATGFGGQKTGARVLNALVGVAFLGYAFYLFFIFDGGTYVMFYYAFVLPILLIIQAFKNRKNAAANPAQAQAQAQATPAQAADTTHA